MKLSVLQWNIWYKEDTKKITRFLQEQNADIICLQELTIDHPHQDVKNAPEYIARELGYSFYYKDIEFEGETEKQANGIFSKYPIINTKYKWINEPTGTGKYDDEYRALIEVVLGIDGKELTVATTHMSYTHKFELTDRKKTEADLLVQHISNAENNYILTGDFNAMPDSYTIAEITRTLQNASPDYSAPSWTTKPFSYDGFEATELKWRLDYIFASKNMKIVDTKTVPTDLSDHLPIVTTFEF